jgi:hypothetical protein
MITDRVAKLLGEQPWPGYDEQRADAIATGLDAVDVDTARQVRSYERGCCSEACGLHCRFRVSKQPRACVWSAPPRAASGRRLRQ